MPFEVVLEHESFFEFNDEYIYHKSGGTRTLASGLSTFGDVLKVVKKFSPDKELRTIDESPPACKIIIEYSPGLDGEYDWSNDTY